MSEQLVYFFGNGKADGRGSMKDLLGGKGANLAEMSTMGIPVPPGFTIVTSECINYYKNDRKISDALKSAVEKNLKAVEDIIGKKLGSKESPLLVSVRSGARASMPGMMDTILNLGLNDETVESLAKITGNRRFALDSYRRLLQMYGDVVMHVDHSAFEDMLTEIKEIRGIKNDTDITESDLEKLVEEYKNIIKNSAKKEFPQNVNDQLWGAVQAVFDSWMNDRAIFYRKINKIPEEWGTAVNIQSMVFGNFNNKSATGVAFTRNPSNGENKYYGEFLVNAQGEDVVAGVRTPQNLLKVDTKQNDSLEEVMPQSFAELSKIFGILEKNYRDMQDIEFTIENGKLWILQTRNGKRTAKAAIKIAIDMVKEGLINEEEALLKIDANSLNQLLHPTINKNAKRQVLTKGLPASPGAASGVIAMSASEVERLSAIEVPAILVRHETSPEDITGMHLSRGILTARGGMTSHAAVVARGMGKCCVSGAEEIKIDYATSTLQIGNVTMKEGDKITIDGSNGEVIFGEIEMDAPEMFDEFATLMEMAKKYKRMQVRTNAETENDCKVALKFGAEGIGLCRTEHMFFEERRIMYVRQMILAETKAERDAALEKLLPIQTEDFVKIFETMKDLPVNIRLLDPPLHEFLPQKDSEIAQIAEELGISHQRIYQQIGRLHEINPMLGHRGSRLGVSFPEIYKMQVRAIFEAAAQVEKKSKIKPKIELMFPLIISKKELDFVVADALEIIESLEKESGSKFNYQIGTMIEVPRACLVADEIAKTATYFSFGTNDLTQMTMGLSRDDSGSFIGNYVEKKMLSDDPFVSIDCDGVGELMKIATERGRKTRPDIKLGICGEHGGDVSSIELCEELGFSYISCSPYRLPVAFLAAAQASVRGR